MKKEEKAFQTLYVVEVKDEKGGPWCMVAAFMYRGVAEQEAKDAACRASLMERYREVRVSEWVRKEVAE